MFNVIAFSAPSVNIKKTVVKIVFCAKILYLGKLISYSLFKRLRLKLFFFSLSFYLTHAVDASLKNNLQIFSRFYFDLHIPSVRFHKFHEIVVTND